MNQEDYTTAEEIVKELDQKYEVSRVRKVHKHVVRFTVREGVCRFKFPEHQYWYVSDVTHYEGEGIDFMMEFVI